MGWLGSALLVVSLLQTKFTRFRVLNTLSCLILIVYNVWIVSWPMVGMNVMLVVINVVYLLRSQRARGVNGSGAR